MKITKRQLKKIISEEYSKVIHEIEQSELEDVEAVEDSWAGGDNLHHQIDHSAAAKSFPVNHLLLS